MGEKGESSNSVMLRHAEKEEALMKTNISEDKEIKKIKLKTSDEVIFEVEPSIVKKMETVQAFIDDDDTDSSTIIPLHSVSSCDLRRILELEFEGFDGELVKTLGLEELKELLLAADYLNMKKLFDFVARRIADFIKNKSHEYVRKHFNIENDFTPEEEAEVRQKHAWAFDGVDE